jgi:hypothetical protein
MLTTDDELEYKLSRPQAGEFIYEQPAFPEVEYIFKHALTQEVAYNTLLIERRKLLHESAGQALESMFARQLEDHLDVRMVLILAIKNATPADSDPPCQVWVVARVAGSVDQYLVGRRNHVGAARSAGEDVVRALNLNSRAEHGAKQP